MLFMTIIVAGKLIGMDINMKILMAKTVLKI